MLQKLIDWFMSDKQHQTSLELYIQRKNPTNLAELEHYLNSFNYYQKGENTYEIHRGIL